MKKTRLKACFAALLGAGMLFFAACQKEQNQAADDMSASADRDGINKLIGYPVLPLVPYNYANLPLPAYLNSPQVNGQKNAPANNLVTDLGATLGRVLFYDKNLSANNSIACASCHKQAFAFSDPAQFSTGFNGGKTGRNSMSLINAAYYPNGHFFWDERAASAEAQASGPIKNAVEMGMTMPSLVAKLQGLPYYPGLFKQAYGTPGIDSVRIVRALAQFVRSLVSYRTKYDAGRALVPAGQDPVLTPYANFTAEENRGKQIFFSPAGGCGACHGTETFTGPAAQNNGLDLVYADNGKGGVTGDPAQDGLFKAPSLRGIEKSAPYMHDGRFATLEQVVEHYNSQVKAHPNLSGPLRTPQGTPRRLNLNASDKAALVAFLKTLTDTGIETDVKYASPFMQ